MKKVYICLLILVQLSFVVNAQRTYPRRPTIKAHRVYKPGIRLLWRPFRRRNDRKIWINQEPIQSDTLHPKQGIK
jgi:hypothetical protein